MKLSQISQTKAAIAAPAKFSFDAADVSPAFTSFASSKVLVPIKPPMLGPNEGTEHGAVDNQYLEDFTDHSDDDLVFHDTIFGNGGFDYISTGGGNDIITVGNNDSTWRGTGNEFTMEATTVNAGSGNDRVSVDATDGAFHITTGEGSDRVYIKGGDYVKIDAYDGDSQQDTFVFAATFGGTAEINGADHAWHDLIVLEGGGTWEGGSWSEVAGGINSELAFYNDDTGGTVIVHGSSATSLAYMPSWTIEMM